MHGKDWKKQKQFKLTRMGWKEKRKIILFIIPSLVYRVQTAKKNFICQFLKTYISISLWIQELRTIYDCWGNGLKGITTEYCCHLKCFSVNGFLKITSLVPLSG